MRNIKKLLIYGIEIGGITKMDEKMKIKYEQLKKNNAKKNKELVWEKNALFTECMHSIREAQIIPEDSCNEILETLNKILHFSAAGHIAWEETKLKYFVVTYDELHKYIDIYKKYYIIWDNYDLPAIMCGLQSIIKNVEDIEAVAFNYLIISEDYKIIMESKKFGYVNIAILS